MIIVHVQIFFSVFDVEVTVFSSLGANPTNLYVFCMYFYSGIFGRILKILNCGAPLIWSATWPKMGCSVFETFFTSLLKRTSLSRALQVQGQSFVLLTGLRE
jgi:hypothetical protein